MDTATPWRIIAAWMPCCPCMRPMQPPQVVPTQEAAVRPSQVDGVARLEVTIQDLQNRLERVENRLDTEVARGEERGGMVMNMQRYDLLQTRDAEEMMEAKRRRIGEAILINRLPYTNFASKNVWKL